jgi:hypothetical protein
MPQLAAISAAVIAAIPSIRGLTSARLRSAVRLSQTSTASATGTDPITRCAITSPVGTASSALKWRGRPPHGT